MHLFKVCFFTLSIAACTQRETTPAHPAILDPAKVEDSLFRAEVIEENKLDRFDTFPLRDIDGDKEYDTAVVHPLTFFTSNHKIDSQYVTIHFSNGFPAIRHYDGFRGTVTETHDLNGDGIREIIYYPDWYQSMEAAMFIYSYNGSAWTCFDTAHMRRDIFEEIKDPAKELQKRVIKINDHWFKVISSYYDAAEGIKDSVELIPVR